MFIFEKLKQCRKIYKCELKSYCPVTSTCSFEYVMWLACTYFRKLGSSCSIFLLYVLGIDKHKACQAGLQGRDWRLLLHAKNEKTVTWVISLKLFLFRILMNFKICYSSKWYPNSPITLNLFVLDIFIHTFQWFKRRYTNWNECLHFCFSPKIKMFYVLLLMWWFIINQQRLASFNFNEKVNALFQNLEFQGKR